MDKRSRSTSPIADIAALPEVPTSSAGLAASSSAPAEPPTKRMKVSDAPNGEVRPTENDEAKPVGSATVSAGGVALGHMTEERAGMTEYINPSLPAFEGIIKQRFTDFMVNEITPFPEASVCRITSLDPPPGQLLQQLQSARGEVDDEALQEERRTLEEKKQKEDAEQTADPTAWPEHANDRLGPFFTTDAIADLRKLWQEGKNPPPPETLVHDTKSGSAEGEVETVGTNEQSSKADEKIAEAGSSAVDRSTGGRSVGKPRNVRDDRKVLSRPLASKAERTQSHAVIRELFQGKLATESLALAADEQEDDEDARVNAAAAGGADSSSASEPLLVVVVRWAQRSDRRTKDFLDEEALNSPPYIHFLLQKTNRDHQEAMVLLAQALGLTGGTHGHHGKGSGTKDFSIAGTKDKRAVTVQRVALKRGRKTLAEVWKALNSVEDTRGGGRGRRGRGGGNAFGRSKSILQAVESRGDRGLRVAHLHYASEPLKLGQLSGNEFTVTLRNVKVPNNDESVIHKAMETIREKGFINYYGMQRFGTGAVPTHEFGILIFKGDYKGAVELLFEERDNDVDDLVEAKKLYREDKFEEAFHWAPRNCIAEKAVLDKMRRRNYTKGDWLGAFGNIPRTLRLMYIHAYQSYIWNRLVSARIKKFGPDTPAVGDIVMLDGDADEISAETLGDVEVDGNGDGEDGARAESDGTGEAGEPERTATGSIPAWKRTTKILTESDIASGVHGIHSVVMPLPGIDISIPAGWMSELYEQMLSEDGLKPSDLTDSKQEEYKLRGSYRKVIQLPKAFSYKLVRYTDPDVALTVADEDRCLGLKPQGWEETLPSETDAQTVPSPEQPATVGIQTNAQADAPVGANTATEPVTAKEDGTAPTPSDEPTATRDPFLALQLNFQLPASAYATMLMREGLKSDTSSFKHRLMTQASEDQAFKGQVRGGGGRGGQHQGRGGRGRGGGGRGGRRGGGRGGFGGRHGEVNQITSNKVRSWGGSA